MGVGGFVILCGLGFRARRDLLILAGWDFDVRVFVERKSVCLWRKGLHRAVHVGAKRESGCQGINSSSRPYKGCAQEKNASVCGDCIF